MKSLTKEDIQFIVEHHKWRFRLIDIWDRYFILIAPLFFIFVAILMTVKTGLKGDSSFPQSSLVTVVIIFFLIGLLLTFFTYKRLESERLFHSITLRTFNNETVKSYLIALGRTIIDENEDLIIVRTKISLTSWGEIVTIVVNGNELLFNSRPDGQPFTINKDSVNFSKFYELISQKEEVCSRHPF